jgi:hypothetical protein
MSTNDEDVVARQNFLREAIIDQGFDPAEFVDHLQSIRGIQRVRVYR